MPARHHLPGPPATGALTEETLVVGFDGSASSGDALALATPLARLWDVGVHVVTIHRPVALGGAHTEDTRALVAARCAQGGAARLDAAIPVSWGERRAADVIAGLHDCAVGSAGLVVGRPRRRWTDRGQHRTVLEDSPAPVAVARRGLLPRAELRHIVLAMTRHDDLSGSEGDLDPLVRFATRLRHHPGVAVTVGALGAGISTDALAECTSGIERVLDRSARTAVLPVHDATRRWDGDELLVCLGRSRGTHGHQGSDGVERALLAEDGPSLLVLPPSSHARRAAGR